MCHKCLLMNVDVSEGIELQATIQRCKECKKYDTITYFRHVELSLHRNIGSMSKESRSRSWA